MKTPLKLLVCEFITGGGFCAQALPVSLLKEAKLMRDALLRDLTALNAYHIFTLHDIRLGASPLVKSSLPVTGQLFQTTFNQALKQANLVWLIAPETDGVLGHLSTLCAKSPAVFLGCGVDAMRICSSKWQSYQAMQAANIDTLPVIKGEDFVLDKYFTQAKALQTSGEWVAKPDAGAGCHGIQLFETLPSLMAWLKQDHRYLNYLVQPYQPGIVGSFSMLCRHGKAWLLSCNQQHITSDGKTLRLTGVTVNGLQTYWQRFDAIARKIAKILPDAMGYIGVDVIIDTENDKIVVVEINPRLTTSYIGLRESIGYNPAQLILDCFLSAHFTLPILQKNQVEITL